ncbi:MAG: thiamine phosphate synthase [Nitrospirae bacterium]|nr:thiamine phosphate synthase [Nitrospirota bacterium]MBF0541655.1 thiamine phosphate synthase [Nitrospirota bacterium]
MPKKRSMERQTAPYLNGICFLTAQSELSDRSILDITMEVIQSGVKWIQLRDKTASRHQLFKIARVLKSIASANNVTLIINDHVDIAMAVDADGVHLGQDDMSIIDARRIIGNKIIGISTHSYIEALEAQRNGADYIGFGPIFHSSTKDAGLPKGIDAIKELRFPKAGYEPISIPIAAIGGITQDSLVDIFNAGANAAAISSGITITKDIFQNASEFVGIINNHFGIKQEIIENTDLIDSFSNKPTENDFKNTLAWQNAMELAVVCNKEVAAFPVSASEFLRTGIERTAFSIPIKIAQGSNELSLMLSEIETLIYLANRLNYISNKKLETIMELIAKIRIV